MLTRTRNYSKFPTDNPHAGTLLISCCVCLAAPAFGQESVTYSELRVLLKQKCVGCHNPEMSRAELDLSSFTSLMSGSQSGPIVVAGNLRESLIYLTTHGFEEPAMPPGRRTLSIPEKKLIADWIAQGARESADAPQVAMAAQPDAAAVASSESPEGPAETNPAAVFISRQGTAVTAMAAHPVQPWVAISGQQQVLIFDVNSAQLIKVLHHPEGEIFALRFDETGDLLLATGGMHAEVGDAVLWDLRTGERSAAFAPEHDILLTADLSPDGRQIVYGGPNMLVRMLDVASGQLRFELTKHTDWITALNFSPEGLFFASGDRTGNLFVWESETGQSLFTLKGHRGMISAICWGATDDFCLTAGDDGQIIRWDLHTGEATRRWQAHPEGVLSLALAPTGIVSTGRDGRVVCWSLEGEQLAEIQQSEVRPSRAIVSGDKLVIGTWTGDSVVANLDLSLRGKLSIDEATFVTTDTPLPLWNGFPEALSMASNELHPEEFLKQIDKLASDLQNANNTAETTFAEIEVTIKALAARQERIVLQRKTARQLLSDLVSLREKAELLVDSAAITQQATVLETFISDQQTFAVTLLKQAEELQREPTSATSSEAAVLLRLTADRIESLVAEKRVALGQLKSSPADHSDTNIESLATQLGSLQKVAAELRTELERQASVAPSITVSAEATAVSANDD